MSDADTTREPDALSALVGELETYLPASLVNQGLHPHPPVGPGTLRGFRAKIAEVFQLGRSVGWDEGQLETRQEDGDAAASLARVRDLAAYWQRKGERDPQPASQAVVYAQALQQAIDGETP